MDTKGHYMIDIGNFLKITCIHKRLQRHTTRGLKHAIYKICQPPTNVFFPLIFLEMCLISSLFYISRFFRIVQKCYNLDGPDSELMHEILIKDSLFRFLCDRFSFVRDGDNLGIN